MSPALISIGRHNTDCVVGMHQHREHELIVVVRGACRIALAGEDHLLGPGQGLLIPAAAAHDQRDQCHCDSYYLKFTGQPDGLAVTARALNHDDDLVPRWCADLERLQEQGDKGCGNALFIAIADRLHRQEQARRSNETLPAPLRLALDHIEAHYHEPIGSAEIAVGAGISASYCTLLFRRHCQRSPGGQLLAVRMRHARRLLADDYRSVAEVAGLVGLPDSNHFARRFRAEHGCPPRVWRSRRSV